ncbi:predicted protein [Botrytis cinerea T4]|uniref:Uncharacterized protein n=1 Tax=Botryotinia fuckeliana (strain T4) TaxID=999810 RepID=G2YAN8_BOTF4|nr:predicted protein [Botrytis cinerea T4]
MIDGNPCFGVDTWTTAKTSKELEHTTQRFLGFQKIILDGCLAIFCITRLRLMHSWTNGLN